MFESFRNLVKTPDLRNKILYTFLFLFIFRIGSHIPIPGINIDVLKQLGGSFGSDTAGGLLTFISSITGGSLANAAIFSLGIMPYISASIIFSLLTKVVPALEKLSEEGPSGYKKINEYTRYATVPLCLIQSFMIVGIFKQPIGDGMYLVDPATSGYFTFTAVISLTAGAIFLMWLGEQITEYGVGNGISLLIMAGIVASMPHQVEAMLASASKSTSSTGVFHLSVLFVIFVVMVVGVIYITFGQRKIPIHQQSRTRGRKIYGGGKVSFPIKVNQAGVMPVIFASSLLIFPSIILTMALGPDRANNIFSPNSFWYISFYAIMIYFFTYFWVSLMFPPEKTAKQLQEHGSFIPGTRPGKKTAAYLEKVMTRITFVGAGFLAIIALIPMFVNMALDLSYAGVGFAYNLGGTSILIMVGVVLDLVQRLDNQLTTRQLEGFGLGGRAKEGRRRR